MEKKSLESMEMIKEKGNIIMTPKPKKLFQGLKDR